MKNISLSQEVKTIVRGMVSNAAKFKLEVLTTFLLFDSMMSQKQFSSLIAKYSSCNLEGIINLIENIYKNNPLGFNEKEVETIEERDYFISVLKDSDIDNPQNFIFSLSVGAMLRTSQRAPSPMLKLVVIFRVARKFDCTVFVRRTTPLFCLILR